MTYPCLCLDFAAV